KCFNQCRESIDPTALRIQIDELRRLARILADTLQTIVIDDLRNKALLVLQLHRIEGTAVAVDAHEEFVLASKVEHESGARGVRLKLARPDKGVVAASLSISLRNEPRQLLLRINRLEP